jgi:outer membrane usher protein FimD/PapC
VFIDANANGKMDPNEPGLEGVQVVADSTFKVTTDRNGYFLFGAIGLSKQSRISIDMNTVPAIYSPTHAMQTALLGPGGLTEINLGVTPLHSISGAVQVFTEKGLQPAQGVRVRLIGMKDNKLVTDSITARDGSYYLGDVRPGKYYIEMDGETLPPKYTFEARKKEVEVAPKTEPQELKMIPFEGRMASKG